MLVDADSGFIVDANAAMLGHLKGHRDAVVGKKISQIFDIADGAPDDTVLGALLASSASAPAQIARRSTHQRLLVSGSLHRVVGDRFLLCRLAATYGVNGASHDLSDAMTAFYTHSSDSIAVTREDGSIITANESFLRLANVPDQSRLAELSLDTFLARGVVDLKIILKNLASNQHLKRYQTSLRDEFGAETRVEISATQVDIDQRRCVVFVLRDVRGRSPAPRSTDYLTDDAAQSIVELIGGVDLKDIVADTTEVVERMCIDVALDMTKNNRVAAANMLGLSRQSLYVKLRKYGL